MGCNRSVLFCSACCILLMHSGALGQQQQSVVKLRAALYGSPEPEQQPARRPRIHNQLSKTGHAMAMQEQRILRFLRSNVELCLPGMSLRQVAKKAGAFVPVYLDEFAAELLQVELDSKIRDETTGAVYSQLLSAIEPVEMTLNIRSGMLWFTSMDTAENKPMICTYEIASANLEQEYDFDRFLEQVRTHVDPDGWLMNGGCAAVTVHERSDQWLLVVSAPLTTQVKTAALLEQMLPIPRMPTRAPVPEPQSLPYYPHPPMLGSGVASNGGFFRVVYSNKPRRSLGAGYDTLSSSSRSLPRSYRRLNWR